VAVAALSDVRAEIHVVLLVELEAQTRTAARQEFLGS
jgi:hypothetical protein